MTEKRPVHPAELDLRGINFEEGYIAVIDKPLGWTSTDVVRKIKFTLRKLGYPKIKPQAYSIPAHLLRNPPNRQLAI